MNQFRFPAVKMPDTESALRASVRQLVDQEVKAGRIVPQSNSWSIHDAAFSQRLGQAGFLGMTWPRRYGGHERSTLERYVVVEELIPESQADKETDIATIGTMVGFAVMMTLDVALG